jgi:hypothetical protein
MDTNKKLRWQAAVVLFVSVALVGPLGWGADDSTQPPTVFVIHVDSVIAPSHIGDGDTLTIRLHGVIGPTLCYRFKEFVFEKTESQLDLTVLGVVPDLRGRACPTALAELRDDNHQHGRPFLVEPPMVDPFRVVVHQPDSSTIARVVRVVPSR